MSVRACRPTRESEVCVGWSSNGRPERRHGRCPIECSLWIEAQRATALVLCPRLPPRSSPSLQLGVCMTSVSAIAHSIALTAPSMNRSLLCDKGCQERAAYDRIR